MRDAAPPEMRAASSMVASSQKAIATAVRPGKTTGRLMAAMAMIPVPMTLANRFGGISIRPP